MLLPHAVFFLIFFHLKALEHQLPPLTHIQESPVRPPLAEFPSVRRSMRSRLPISVSHPDSMTKRQVLSPIFSGVILIICSSSRIRKMKRSRPPRPVGQRLLRPDCPHRWKRSRRMGRRSTARRMLLPPLWTPPCTPPITNQPSPIPNLALRGQPVPIPSSL